MDEHITFSKGAVVEELLPTITVYCSELDDVDMEAQMAELKKMMSARRPDGQHNE